MLAFATDLALLDLLQDAEHHVAAAEWRITCQLEYLAQLQREGGSTRAAEAVLDALKQGRDAWDARRAEILGRMGSVGRLDRSA
jgi:hypothetical protein